uniref:Uncharacterized protein n=1 Tax=Chromera velia CCMP2878 TaxID=1169474 RepID=A0A0G4HY81_9ALVE|eukprot:Cvel_9425.t1-p1 / transcript=Cvel_9425.t1 / gene=Cvel_9425 / organism=Chromera_velia_CCMP2878 / gene_product=hypothetical protein / transcript_product=hypothetical protein / location=Cvel_scaffold543:21833-24803(-) / protein_length=390 / sequence_SO=supercontig / SO=protein_coding / is_pseudo=false
MDAVLKAVGVSGGGDESSRSSVVEQNLLLLKRLDKLELERALEEEEVRRIKEELAQVESDHKRLCEAAFVPYSFFCRDRRHQRGQIEIKDGPKTPDSEHNSFIAVVRWGFIPLSPCETSPSPSSSSSVSSASPAPTPTLGLMGGGDESRKGGSSSSAPGDPAFRPTRLPSGVMNGQVELAIANTEMAAVCGIALAEPSRLDFSGTDVWFGTADGMVCFDAKGALFVDGKEMEGGVPFAVGDVIRLSWSIQRERGKKNPGGGVSKERGDLSFRTKIVLEKNGDAVAELELEGARALLPAVCGQHFDVLALPSSARSSFLAARKNTPLEGAEASPKEGISRNLVSQAVQLMDEFHHGNTGSSTTTQAEEARNLLNEHAERAGEHTVSGHVRI